MADSTGQNPVEDYSDTLPRHFDDERITLQKILARNNAASGVDPATGAGGSSGAATRVDSGINVASAVLKASAGMLKTIYGYNSGSAGYILIFDSATVPADGNTTGRGFAVPGTGNFSLDVNTPYANGISVCISSTYASKTIAAGSLNFVATVI